MFSSVRTLGGLSLLRRLSTVPESLNFLSNLEDTFGYVKLQLVKRGAFLGHNVDPL